MIFSWGKTLLNALYSLVTSDIELLETPAAGDHTFHPFPVLAIVRNDVQFSEVMAVQHSVFESPGFKASLFTIMSSTSHISSSNVADYEDEDFQLWTCYMSSRLRAAIKGCSMNPIHPEFLSYLRHEAVSCPGIYFNFLTEDQKGVSNHRSFGLHHLQWPGADAPLFGLREYDACRA